LAVVHTAANTLQSLHPNTAVAEVFMFTGIVQTCTPISHFVEKPGLISFAITLTGELAEGLNIGASIAINGICLTVSRFELTPASDSETNASPASALVFFDMMQQTLNLTNAITFANGTQVNVERSAKAMQEVGGHIVSGHVDAQARLVSITHSENNCCMRFSYPSEYAKYLLNKGFVGLNGCSLTLAEVNHEQHYCEVWFIPETLRATTFGILREGDTVNLEIERQTQAIVDTVERVLAAQQASRA
jgi:riboflavin synthase